MNKLSFKLSFVFAVLAAFILLSGSIFINNARADQKSSSPLIMQQSSTLPSPGAMPLGIAGAPGTPPSPPPGPAGVPVVQTIPIQTLLANLPQATTTAGELSKLLSLGKVWIMSGPAGDSDIKCGLLYKGVVVAVLHINPADGSVLPLGINPHTYQSNIDINSIKSALSSVIENLKILQAAEFMEPEACWSFPIAVGNKIVAHVKIYYDGIHVIEDYAANQEMSYYGQ